MEPAAPNLLTINNLGILYWPGSFACGLDEGPRSGSDSRGFTLSISEPLP